MNEGQRDASARKFQKTLRL